MDEQTKKAKWEVVSLAKEIFARSINPIPTEWNEKESLYKNLPFDEEEAKRAAVNSLKAAEIFYEELAKKEGAV